MQPEVARRVAVAEEHRVAVGSWVERVVGVVVVVAWEVSERSSSGTPAVGDQ